MKLQLGIFQEQEQINKYLESKGIEHHDIMVAGPFPTRLQAVEWMDFIEKRTGQGKAERHAVGLMNQQPWYGISFEQKAPATARKNVPASPMQMSVPMH
ncbi:MAG: hypothetical protein PHI97_06110 [Desulfobulbus sp.]|nr:hypothetical protein [Desulfobulbus sp.]